MFPDYLFLATMTYRVIYGSNVSYALLVWTSYALLVWTKKSSSKKFKNVNKVKKLHILQKVIQSNAFYINARTVSYFRI